MSFQENRTHAEPSIAGGRLVLQPGSLAPVTQSGLQGELRAPAKGVRHVATVADPHAIDDLRRRSRRRHAPVALGTNVYQPIRLAQPSNKFRIADPSAAAKRLPVISKGNPQQTTRDQHGGFLLF